MADEVSRTPRPVEVHEFSQHSIVAMFDSPFQAECAVEELLRRGFPRASMRVVSKVDRADFAEYGGATAIGAPPEKVDPEVTGERRKFAAELGRIGVSEEHALWYWDRIEDGMYLLALLTGDRDEAREAADALDEVAGERGEADGKGAERFGRELAAKPRNRGRRWYHVEMELRGYWEGRFPGTWERHREAVREGYEQGQRIKAA